MLEHFNHSAPIVLRNLDFTNLSRLINHSHSHEVTGIVTMIVMRADTRIVVCTHAVSGVSDSLLLQYYVATYFATTPIPSGSRKIIRL